MQTNNFMIFFVENLTTYTGITLYEFLTHKSESFRAMIKIRMNDVFKNTGETK